MRIANYVVLSGCLLLSACSDLQPAKTATVGGYALQVKTDPAPLMVGKSAGITLSIHDGINQPANNCKVRFRQYMPGHEMELDDTYVLMVDQAKVGKYAAHSGEFRMGGDWVIEFDFACGKDRHTQPFDYHLEWPE